MGALTHNGEVLQSLPANASQINFNKTGTNLNSTQTENAIKEVNTKVNTNTTDINQLKSGLTNNSVNLTTSELFQIINQGSHMLTSGVLHIFAKIKCVALPAEGVNDFDFVFLPSGKEIVTNQRGIVINVGKASSEWVTPSSLVYGYVGTSSISGHTSDLTVGSYYLIDVIIKLAVS